MAAALSDQSHSVKNRTAEFSQIVQRLQQSQGLPTSSIRAQENGPSTSGLGAPPPDPLAARSEFARRAARVGLGIHSTSQKLARLSALARRTSLFDDPAEEINELSTVVKQDVQALNQAISDLAAFSAGGGPSRQAADHTHAVVDTLRSRLKDAAREFRDVLTARTDSLRAHAERKQLFTAEPERRAPPLFAAPAASFLPANARGGAPVRGGLQGGGGAEAAPLLGGAAAPSHAAAPAQSQQLVFAQAPQADAYLASRAEALHSVESTIVELGGIFQQLAHMVHEQGEMAVRIDENVGGALASVEAGQAQLLRYLSAVSSNRWLLLKVFALLVAFLTFFVVFVA